LHATITTRRGNRRPRARQKVTKRLRATKRSKTNHFLDLVVTKSKVDSPKSKRRIIKKMKRKIKMIKRKRKKNLCKYLEIK